MMVPEERSPRTFAPQERLGVNAVERIVTSELEWLWREQFVADFGIDGHIEVLRDGRPTGRLFAVQVKSGASYFRGNSDAVVFYVDDDHMQYWSQHILPVILVLHNPDDGTTLWQWANIRTAQATEKGWRIEISRSNRLGPASRDELQDQTWSDDGLGLRRRFALDRQFMERFEGRDAYVRIDKWVNKHLQYREIYIAFDDPEGEPAFEIPIMATWGYDVGDIIRHFLPWLRYEYVEDPDNTSGEVESHVFSVELSDAAKGYLAAERFFENPSTGRDEVIDDDNDNELYDRYEVDWPDDEIDQS